MKWFSAIAQTEWTTLCDVVMHGVVYADSRIVQPGGDRPLRAHLPSPGLVYGPALDPARTADRVRHQPVTQMPVLELDDRKSCTVAGRFVPGLADLIK
jgi:hypothetical protein